MLKMPGNFISSQPLAVQLGFAIKCAYQAQRAALDEALRDRGITTAQFGTLVWLRFQDGASSADLARLHGCRPQTMNDIVKHLEAHGLIERAHHPTNGTLLVTRLTAAGSDLLDECSRRVAEIQEHMLSTLGDEQCEQLIATLEKCVHSLHQLPASEDGCPDLL